MRSGFIGEVFRLAEAGRRARKFRCGACGRLVERGEAAIVERVAPKRTRGYHTDCFVPGSIAAWAAVERHLRATNGEMPANIGWTLADVETMRQHNGRHS